MFPDLFVNWLSWKIVKNCGNKTTKNTTDLGILLHYYLIMNKYVWG